MKKLIGIELMTLTLSSCGTAQGVMNGVGLRLRANRLILGKVMKEWIVGARTHLSDEFGDQGARQALREGEPQLVARVNDAVDDDPILAQAIARGNCGEGFALHDKITA